MYRSHVGEGWLREARRQLQAPQVLARLAPDSMAALMTALTEVGGARTSGWGPHPQEQKQGAQGQQRGARGLLA